MTANALSLVEARLASATTEPASEAAAEAENERATGHQTRLSNMVNILGAQWKNH